MAIKFLYSSEKTNAFRPTPWHFSTEKFPAYRGNGHKHRGFLAVAKNYEPTFVGNQPNTDGYSSPTSSFDVSASKLITTKERETLLLVPCPDEENEQILLITLRGGFRGGYSRIKAVGGEVFVQNSSGGHCVVTGHMVVRLTDPRGYVYAETGRRCSQGLVEVFSWDGYKTMPTEDFEVWREMHAPDMKDRSEVAQLKADAEAERVKMLVDTHAAVDAYKAKVAEAETAKPQLLPRLEKLNERLSEINHAGITLNEANFKYGWSEHDYAEDDVRKIEERVAKIEAEVAKKKVVEAKMQAERDAVRQSLQGVSNRFATLGHDLDISENGYMWEGYRNHFTEAACAEMLEKLEKLEQEAAAEAERSEKVTQAANAGLPSSIEIWSRTGGRTNAGDGWVIQPDGMEREPTSMYNANPRRLQRYGEGYKVWEQIFPGELVLRWSKSNSAADHEFEVVYVPEEITESQLEAVSMIEGDIDKDWETARGISSGKVSPPVGDGWDLMSTAQLNTAEDDGSPPKSASRNQLAALQERFQ